MFASATLFYVSHKDIRWTIYMAAMYVIIFVTAMNKNITKKLLTTIRLRSSINSESPDT